MEERGTCRRCEKEFPVEILMHDMFDDTFICQDCMEESLSLPCYDCGKIVGKAKDKPHLLFGGKYRCKTCREAYKVTHNKECGCCAKPISDEEVAQKVTRKRFDYGYGYGHLYSLQGVSKPKQITETTYICKQCSEKGISFCYDCNKILSEGDKVYNIDGKRYCLTCGEKHSVVKKYRTKPLTLNFFKSPIDNELEKLLYFGLELEVDDGLDREHDASYIKRAFGDDKVYLSRDGSLTQDKGFEITTHPMTYEYLLSKKYIFADAMLYLKDHSWKSDSAHNCGIHVHVNKDYFTNWERAVCYMYKMVDSKTALEFGGKSKANFLKYSAPIGGFELADTVEEEQAILYNVRKYTNRNVMFNILNDKTIEFRIFDGTLDVERLFNIFKFVKFVCEKCEERTKGVTEDGKK